MTFDCAPPNACASRKTSLPFSPFSTSSTTKKLPLHSATMSPNTKDEGAGIAPSNRGSWSSFLKVRKKLCPYPISKGRETIELIAHHSR